MMPSNGNGAKESIARIEELVRRVELLPDPFARDAAVELVQAVMALHQNALEKIVDIVAADAAGGATLEAMVKDDLVSSVLVLHGVHPDDLQTRLDRAIEKLQFHFDSRGAGIALIEAGEETVRVRYTAARSGGGEAAKRLIEEAIFEAAPEIASVVIDGLEEKHRDSGFVPLADLVGTARA